MPAKISWEDEMKDKKMNQQMLPPFLNSAALSCMRPGSGGRTAHSGLEWVPQSRSLYSSALV